MSRKRVRPIDGLEAAIRAREISVLISQARRSDQIEPPQRTEQTLNTSHNSKAVRYLCDNFMFFVNRGCYWEAERALKEAKTAGAFNGNSDLDESQLIGFKRAVVRLFASFIDRGQTQDGLAIITDCLDFPNDRQTKNPIINKLKEKIQSHLKERNVSKAVDILLLCPKEAIREFGNKFVEKVTRAGRVASPEKSKQLDYIENLFSEEVT